VFNEVNQQISFPSMEKSILEFWKSNDIFQKTQTERQDSSLFVIYEGPPTANAAPGIHHVLARVFKDVIPRYKTMCGFKVLRKGGWDTHGLPVELEIEKELGLSSKHAIETYGIEKFNAKCRSNVLRYVKAWEDLTDRIGFWVDMDDAYITFSNDYIETGWWILKQAWSKGLLYEGMKGVPHCPRCVTSLSSHEVALGYRENTPDPSIYVKFPVQAGFFGTKTKPKAYDLLTQNETFATPTFFLAWTTTPWTMPGNTALGIAPTEDYVVAKIQGTLESEERLILAKALVSKVIDQDYVIEATIKGSDLVGMTYTTPYDAHAAGVAIQKFEETERGSGTFVELKADESVKPRVFPASFITIEDGTGIGHIAPAFGDEDLQAGRQHHLNFVQHVNLQGLITGNFTFSGKFVKDADKFVVEDLENRNLLHHKDTYLHTYPFCWRCSTPLVYYAKNSWYIMTTAFKDQLVSANDTINWYPDHIKNGRFGEWLRNNVDWAISRERYWGTPIPIWKCSNCDHRICIESLSDLKEQCVDEANESFDFNDPDLHKPYVDRIPIKCSQCSNLMWRIPEVMDCWFDSGIMPFAQWHYPFENKTLLEDNRFPADYICEAVDQTRGWFYSLHAVSNLILDKPSFQNVICLGLILDEKGEKMSKSRGNVVEPWAVLDAQGADALRWYLFTAAPPGNARRFSAGLVQESLRQFLLTLWNTYSFFITYANLDSFKPYQIKDATLTELDRWILSELHALTNVVTQYLDSYNPTDAARKIQEFVNILSNWYVRRSRRRFWKSENDKDKESAYLTLYECLVTVTKLLAPFAPFIAEELYQNLVRTVDVDAPLSVHLADWPQSDASQINTSLGQAMDIAMRISSLGRAARSKAQIKVRQPISEVWVKLRSSDQNGLVQLIEDQVLDELNTKVLGLTDKTEDFAEFNIQLNKAQVGPKYGGELPRLTQLIQDHPVSELLLSIQSGGQIRIGDYELDPTDFRITAEGKPGYSVMYDNGYFVAVNTQLSESLVMEGFTRELVHRVQNLRRSTGLEVSDQIKIYYHSDSRFSKAIEEYTDYINQETLSLELIKVDRASEQLTESFKVNELEISIGIHKH
tara:strand:+ start:465 stop:3752 length:3288 start_codon:yes stop_codon:yes gene_type:complete